MSTIAVTEHVCTPRCPRLRNYLAVTAARVPAGAHASRDTLDAACAGTIATSCLRSPDQRSSQECNALHSFGSAARFLDTDRHTRRHANSSAPCHTAACCVAHAVDVLACPSIASTMARSGANRWQYRTAMQVFPRDRIAAPVVTQKAFRSPHRLAAPPSRMFTRAARPPRCGVMKIVPDRLDHFGVARNNRHARFDATRCMLAATRRRTSTARPSSITIPPR